MVHLMDNETTTDRSGEFIHLSGPRQAGGWHGSCAQEQPEKKLVGQCSALSISLSVFLSLSLPSDSVTSGSAGYPAGYLILRYWVSSRGTDRSPKAYLRITGLHLCAEIGPAGGERETLTRVKHCYTVGAKRRMLPLFHIRAFQTRTIPKIGRTKHMWLAHA